MHEQYRFMVYCLLKINLSALIIGNRIINEKKIRDKKTSGVLLFPDVASAIQI